MNHENIIQKLNSIAELKRKDIIQTDTYYVPQHRNFLDKNPVSEWLRIRESAKGASLNYKRWHNDHGETVSCDEYETSVDPKALRHIFLQLDFKELIVVEKKRSTWLYKKVKIAIDNVTDLGNFIELEATDFDDIKSAKEHLYSVLKELNVDVGSQNFKGYPYNILEKKSLLK